MHNALKIHKTNHTLRTQRQSLEHLSEKDLVDAQAKSIYALSLQVETLKSELEQHRLNSSTQTRTLQQLTQENCKVHSSNLDLQKRIAQLEEKVKEKAKPLCINRDSQTVRKTFASKACQADTLKKQRHTLSEL